MLTPEMEPKCCPQTYVTNYLYSLRNNPEEHSSHLLQGGRLKLRNKLSTRQSVQKLRRFQDFMAGTVQRIPNVTVSLKTETARSF